MDAERLEVEDSAFDAALCALGLMYMPNPVAALAEMRRAVKARGRVAVAVWGERRHCGWAEIFPIVDARVQSEVCPLFFQLGAPGALAAAMVQAGLSNIVERRIDSPLVFRDDASLLAAQIVGVAVALAARRFSPEILQKDDTAFLASVAAYRRDDGSFVIPRQFVVAARVAQ